MAPPARIRVTSPEAGARLLVDPDAPAAFSTLALTVSVEPAAAQVLWWADGRPWRLAELPGEIRWPLQRGEHVFQARLLTGESSPPVRVRVE